MSLVPEQIEGITSEIWSNHWTGHVNVPKKHRLTLFWIFGWLASSLFGSLILTSTLAAASGVYLIN